MKILDMPTEVLALLAQPFLLVAVLAMGVLAGMKIEQMISKKRQAAWQAKNGSLWKKRDVDGVAAGRGRVRPVPPPDAADQLRIVMGATFSARPLLNKPEARLFKELDRVVVGRNGAWQVMAQVSLGEILRSQDPVAYGCVNSKRIDLLLVDGDCRPRHAIEYQGDGHHQGTAAARDAVKKEALRRAGIGYHEVVAGQTTPADLRRLVESLVDEPMATTAVPE